MNPAVQSFLQQTGSTEVRVVDGRWISFYFELVINEVATETETILY